MATNKQIKDAHAHAAKLWDEAVEAGDDGDYEAARQAQADALALEQGAPDEEGDAE